MSNRSEFSSNDKWARREQIIGLGEKSLKKNYYPELLKQIDELKASEAKYRRIVDTSNEGIWVIGEDFKTIFVNERMADMLGVKPEEMVDRPVTDFMLKEDFTDHHRKMKNRQHGLSEIYERRYLHKSGQTVWTIASATPIFDKEHNFKGSFAMFTDITERKKTEEELKKYREHLENLVQERTSQLEVAKEQAEMADRAKSTFLAYMSHELRTPLNAILGFARLSKEAPDVTPEQKRNLDIITLSGGHLLNLINNVLDISKIESGHMTLDVAAVNLNQLLLEIQSLLYVNAAERGLSFVVEESPELPRCIEVDMGKLRQILINLIGNAIKYTKQGGIILRVNVVKKVAKQVRLKFEVEDTGPGIHEEKRKEIFRPFIQAREQGAIETGTGLGLTISRQYVELMGGHIDVFTEKGKGSTFFFEIPVRELPLEKWSAVPERGRAIGIEKGQPRYRLLIAEDQLENRILLYKILEPFGFEIREAVNGKEAIEICEQWHPDLIWMDIRMPVMDGLEATHRIKSTEAGAHTKIVAVTAQAMEEDKASIMHAGCDDFIRKPYREMELFDALSRNLGLRFVYEKMQTVTPKEPQIELRPEHLENIPGELIKELHLAVIGLDPERIQELTKKVMDYDQVVGTALKKSASRFDYRRLLQLLDEYVKDHEAE